MKAVILALVDGERPDVTALRMDEAVARLVAIKLLRQEYTTQQVPEPRWLGDQQLLIERRIRDLRYDVLALELARLKGELAADLTPDERRQSRQQRISELEAALNG